MNKNCLDDVKDGEGWMIYLISFLFMVFETHSKPETSLKTQFFAPKDISFWIQ